MLTNVFNRLARTCFYTIQKATEGRVPVGDVSPSVLADAERALLNYERSMHRKFFPQAFGGAEKYIRGVSKTWNRETQNVDFEGNPSALDQLLIDTFHALRVAAIMMHPFVPAGCEKIREQLALGEEFWSWEHVFEPVYFFMDDPHTHQPKLLEPRQDFFERHPSQYK